MDGSSLSEPRSKRYLKKRENMDKNIPIRLHTISDL